MLLVYFHMSVNKSSKQDEGYEMSSGWCKEAAVNPCSVCGKRVGVNSIHCATCGYWVHERCSEVQRSLVRVAQGFVCKVCRAGGRNATDEFHFEDVKLECVCVFRRHGE